MTLIRTPLLLEGVKKKMKRWKKAHADLERVTRKGYKKLQRRVSAWEKRRPGETPKQHTQRLATSHDVDTRLHDRIVNEPKMRSRLDRVKAVEERRRKSLERSERRRDAKKQRKRMMKATIPSLEPARPLTTVARAVAAKMVRPVRKPAVARSA